MAVSPPAVLDVEPVVPRNLMGSFEAAGQPCFGGLASQLHSTLPDSYVCCQLDLEFYLFD